MWVGVLLTPITGTKGSCLVITGLLLFSVIVKEILIICVHDHSVASEQSFSVVLFVRNTYLHEMMINYSLTLGCF